MINDFARDPILLDRVRSAFSQKKVPHAFLLLGPESDRAAQLLAQALLCEKRSFPPCGQCAGCRKVEKGIHPDLTVICEKSITVEQIRSLRTESFVLPNDADRKVTILSHATRMRPEAQNAFLKLLEQPPQGVYFLLTDEHTYGLIDTVLSRVVQLVLPPQAQERRSDSVCGPLWDAIDRKSEPEILAALEKGFGADRDKAVAFLSAFLGSLNRRALAANGLDADLALDRIARETMRTLENGGNLNLTAAWMTIRMMEVIA